LSVGVVASGCFGAVPLVVQAEALRVWAVSSGEVVAAVSAESSSETADSGLSVASGGLVAVAAIATKKRSATGAVALNFDGRAAWNTSVGGVDWAELSVLSTAELSLGVVASVSLGTVPLSSAAELAVVGAEVSGRVEAARTTEIPSHCTQDLVVVADSVVGVVAGAIADGVGDGGADVVIDALEACSVHASAFTADVDSFSSAFVVVVANLGEGDREADRE